VRDKEASSSITLIDKELPRLPVLLKLVQLAPWLGRTNVCCYLISHFCDYSALLCLCAEGVRLAIGEGGCCASRALFVGALLGACAGMERGGGAPVFPDGWQSKYSEYHKVVKQAQELCHSRLH